MALPFGNKCLLIQKKKKNCSNCKIFGHSQLKCQVVKKMVDSGRSTCPDPTAIRLANGYVDTADHSPMSGPDNVAVDIINHITSPVKARKEKDVDIPKSLSGNTFECLAICEDSGNLEVDIERSPSRYGSPTTPVISDTSNAVVISFFFFLDN